MVLLSVLKLLGIVLNTVVFAPLVVAAAAIDGRWGYRLSRLWVRINLLLTGVRIHAAAPVLLVRHPSRQATSRTWL